MNPPTDDLEYLHNEHVKYLKEKGQYKLNCSCEIFNNEQIEILKEFGHWFTALVNGTLEPFTQAQRDFIKAANGETDPVSIEEKTWFLYLKRKEYEKKHGDRLKARYVPEEDAFFSREDAKKVRGAMMGTVSQTHSQGMQTPTFGRHKKK